MQFAVCFLLRCLLRLLSDLITVLGGLNRQLRFYSALGSFNSFWPTSTMYMCVEYISILQATLKIKEEEEEEEDNGSW